MFKRKRQSATELASHLSELLTGALGEQLLSLTQFFPFHGSVNEPVKTRLYLLLLVDTVEVDLLSKCSEVIKEVDGTEVVVPRVMSHSELVASTDVFPITFLEMKQHYKVLAGQDYLADLSISDVHLRLRCEQELRNLLLRMQSSFVLRKHSTAGLLETLSTSIAALQRCQMAIKLMCYGDEVELQANEDVLRRAEELCNSSSAVGSEAITEVYGLLLEDVRRICLLVDNLSVA